jgi:hypothetical protein
MGVTSGPTSAPFNTAALVTALAGQSTAVKTSAYTAAAGERVLLDSAGSAFNVTLPTSPPHGTPVKLVDTTGGTTAHAVTVLPGGSNTVLGNAGGVAIDDGTTLSLLFNSGTGDWENDDPGQVVAASSSAGSTASAWNGANTAVRAYADLRKDWVTLSDYTGSSTPGECHTALLNALQGTEHRHLVINKGDWTLSAQVAAALGRDKVVHCEGAKITYAGAATDFAVRILAVGFDCRWEGGEIDGANLAAQCLKFHGRSTNMTSGLSRVEVEGFTARQGKINAAIGDVSAGIYVYAGFEEIVLKTIKIFDITRALGAGVNGSYGTNGFVSSTTNSCYVRRTIMDDIFVQNILSVEADGAAANSDCDAVSIHCSPDVSDAFVRVRDFRCINTKGRMLKSQCPSTNVDGWYYRHTSTGPNPIQGGLELINFQFGGGSVSNGRVVLDSLGTAQQDCIAVSSGVSGSVGTMGLDTFINNLHFYNGTAQTPTAVLLHYDSMNLPRTFCAKGVSMIGNIGLGLYLGDTSNASSRPLTLLLEGWKGNFTGFPAQSAPKLVGTSASTYGVVHAHGCRHTGGSAVPLVGSYNAVGGSNANLTVSGTANANVTASWG